jgi:hypothetical protein
MGWANRKEVPGSKGRTKSAVLNIYDVFGPWFLMGQFMIFQFTMTQKQAS